MNDFIKSIVRQLQAFQDDPQWMSYDYVSEVLRQAARETMLDPGAILLKHGHQTSRSSYTIIESTLTGVSIALDASEIRALRAYLITWDEGQHGPAVSEHDE